MSTSSLGIETREYLIRPQRVIIGNNDSNDNYEEDNKKPSLEELALQIQSGSVQAEFLLISSYDSYFERVAKAEAYKLRLKYPDLAISIDEVKLAVQTAALRTAKRFDRKKSGSFKTPFGWDLRDEKRRLLREQGYQEYKPKKKKRLRPISLNKTFEQSSGEKTERVFKDDKAEQPFLESCKNEEQDILTYQIGQVFELYTSDQSRLMYLKYGELFSCEQVGLEMGFSRARIGQFIKKLTPIFERKVRLLNISANIDEISRAIKEWYKNQSTEFVLEGFPASQRLQYSSIRYLAGIENSPLINVDYMSLPVIKQATAEVAQSLKDHNKSRTKRLFGLVNKVFTLEEITQMSREPLDKSDLTKEIKDLTLELSEDEKRIFYLTLGQAMGINEIYAKTRLRTPRTKDILSSISKKLGKRLAYAFIRSNPTDFQNSVNSHFSGQYSLA